jgi:serine/threonine protein kinase
MPEELKTLTSPWDVAIKSVEVGSCLSDDEVLAFALGDLKDEKLERVHAHVDSCSVCQRLVAEAAHAVDSEPIVESDQPSWNTVFQRNTIVSKRYRVLRLIARGGMGEVYEAYDSALQERVALKTVTSTACDSVQAMRALKAEVQLARRISHPNVCRIYDLGTHVVQSTGEEIQYLVMELVVGEGLGKKLRENGPLPLEQAQSIARQLLHGLRAAHHAGILHRDFKSDNVILRTDRNGRIAPVILDFGLAKALNERGNAATTQGQAHAMIGTIGYMAPEQIEGEPLSRASDLYAFGVVWFEMLTGRLPFESSSPAASALARLHRPAEPPSTLNPQVPACLDDIILKCLSRDPQTRFESAESVLEALVTVVDVPMSEPPRTERELPIRWSRWGLGVAATAIAVSSVVAAIHWRTRTPKPPLPSVQSLPVEASIRPPFAAKGITVAENEATSAPDVSTESKPPESTAAERPKGTASQQRDAKLLPKATKEQRVETVSAKPTVAQPSKNTTLPDGWLPLANTAGLSKQRLSAQ